MRRTVRIAATTGAAVLVVAGVAATLAWRSLDPTSLKPRVEAAVLRATGRALSLEGPLRLTLLPQPGFAAQDVALANLPGGSRPQMVTARRLAARFSLQALLAGRIEVSSLVLDGPDLLLERTASGPNWVFTPRAAQGAAQGAAAPAGSEAAAPERRARPLDVRAIRVSDGRVTWNGAGSTTLSVVSLLATEGAAALHVSASLTHDGAPFALAADTGTLATIATPEGTRPPRPAADAAGAAGASAPASDAPWPVDVTLSTPGGDSVEAKGGVTRDGGYDLALHGAVADLAALNPLFPHARLPPVRQLHLDGRLGGAPGRPPAVSALLLTAGPSDLGTLRAGLGLASASVEQRDAGGLTRVALRGALDGATLALDGTLGPWAGVGAALPVDLTASGAGAVATLRGTAGPGGRAGGALDLAVSLRAPQLAALSALARTGLPALRDVAAEARVSSPSPGVLAVRGLRATSAGGDVSGDLALGGGPRPFLRGTLVSQRLDGDALMLAWQQTPRLTDAAGTPPSAPTPSPAPTPVPALIPAPAQPVPPQPVPAPAGRSGQAAPSPRAGQVATASANSVIPDTPLPFAALDAGALDLAFAAGSVSAGGVTWSNAAGHLLLEDGRLALSPFTAGAPHGPVAVQARVDGRATPPTISARARIPDLPLAPLLAMAGQEGAAGGLLGVDMALDAAGGSLRALAATVSGHLGIGAVDGEVQDHVLQAAFAPALRAAGIPPPALDGATAVRCLALRLDLEAGEGSIGALALDSARLRLDGGGTVDLRQEMLALTLRPVLRLGGTVVGMPVAVDGPLGAPRAKVDSGRGGGLTIGGADGPDLCPAALATARGGMAGPPSAAAAPAKPPKPADLLRSLFH
jgi:uncharacterized protein involved in outer membrane biogenesis